MNKILLLTPILSLITIFGMEKDISYYSKVQSLKKLAFSASISFLNREIPKEKKNRKTFRTLDQKLSEYLLPIELEQSLIVQLIKIDRFKKALNSYFSFFYKRVKKKSLQPKKVLEESIYSPTLKELLLERYVFKQQDLKISNFTLENYTGEIPTRTSLTHMLYAFCSDDDVPTINSGNLVGWDLKTGKKHYSIACTSPIDTILSNKDYLVTHAFANLITLFEKNKNERFYFHHCYKMALSNHHLATVNDDGINIITLATKSKETIPLSPDLTVTGLALNDTFIAARLHDKTDHSHDNTLQFWQLDTLNNLDSYKTPPTYDNDLHIWDSLIFFISALPDYSHSHLKAIDLSTGISTVLFSSEESLHSLRIFGRFACCVLGKSTIIPTTTAKVLLINLNHPEDQRIFTGLPTERPFIWPVAVIGTYLIIQAEQRYTAACQDSQLLIFNIETGDQVHSMLGTFITSDPKTMRFALQDAPGKSSITWNSLPSLTDE